MSSRAAPSLPQATIILLGASNMSRALATLYAVTQSTCGGPADYFIATGHGRSYGLYSRVLGRGLPGIIHSGLWQAVERHPASGKIYALLTDVGNDIAYGQAPEQILEWVEICIRRLLAIDAQIVMTGLPLESLETLRPARYFLYRTLLFPSNRKSLAATLSAAQNLNASLQALATNYRIPLIEQPVHWFGPDPVHIRRRDFTAAYCTVTSPWRGDTNVNIPNVSVPLSTRLRLLTATPQWQDVLHWRYQRTQPVVRLADGSALSFF